MRSKLDRLKATIHSKGFPAVPLIHFHHLGLGLLRLELDYRLLSAASDFLSVRKLVWKEEAEIELELVTLFALISGQRTINGEGSHR